MIARRAFLFSLSGLIAAPAIVRAASLMPVRRYRMTFEEECEYLEGSYVPWRLPAKTEAEAFDFATGDLNYNDQLQRIVSSAPILRPHMTSELKNELTLARQDVRLERSWDRRLAAGWGG